MPFQWPSPQSTASKWLQPVALGRHLKLRVPKESKEQSRFQWKVGLVKAEAGPDQWRSSRQGDVSRQTTSSHPERLLSRRQNPDGAPEEENKGEELERVRQT